MNTKENINAGDIVSIDFDLALNHDTYAQTTIRKHEPRCKVFYCFKNEDTREDGEDRCTHDTFTEICSQIAETLTTCKECHSGTEYNLVITLSDKRTFTFKNSGLSPETLSAVISTLSQHIDEFTFLPAFIPYL